MKFVLPLILCLFLAAAPAGAQVLESFLAQDPLSQTNAKAATDLGADASLHMVGFFAANQSGLTISMDPATGKATMWAYFYYSASAQKVGLYVVTKVPVLGFYITAIPADSLGNVPVNQLPPLGSSWVNSNVGLQGALAGGAASFFQAHSDAMVSNAIAVYNPVQIPSPPIPPGPLWRFQFASAADTLDCVVNGTTGQSIFCGTLTSVPLVSDAGAFSLDQNYPNPAGLSAGITTIRFHVPDGAIRNNPNRQLAIRVFDALGREVRTVASGEYDPGSYSVSLDVSTLSSGVYFYRLITPAGNLTRRLIVTH